MIAETIPKAYDALGHKVSQPFQRRRGPHPTFPMGRYVSQPLAVTCETIPELRKFLTECKYVSDKQLFGKEDYWQPPEEFEKRKKGDCDDFSLWTWRQLLKMGYDARIVFGRHGRYGTGHAWVQFFKDGRCFLVEPQLRRVGNKMPRLSTVRYVPELSVAWDGHALSHYAHSEGEFNPDWRELPVLLLEWAKIWVPYGLWTALHLPLVVRGLVKRVITPRRTI